MLLAILLSVMHCIAQGFFLHRAVRAFAILRCPDLPALHRALLRARAPSMLPGPLTAAFDGTVVEMVVVYERGASNA